MLNIKSTKRLERAFKNSKLCHLNKKEGEVIEEAINEVIKHIDFQKELDFISKLINEPYENVIAITGYLYSDISTKEAIKRLYEELKILDEKYNDIELENMIKNFRIKKEVEDSLSNKGFNKNIIAKAAYIKEAINAVKMCDIF
jgi:hypothetical protein